MEKQKETDRAKFLEEFVALAKTKQVFKMFDGYEQRNYFKVPVGNAEYVYRNRITSREENLYIQNQSQYDLFAIIVKDIVYLDLYDYERRANPRILPENTVYFGAAIEEMQQRLRDTMVYTFVSQLNIPDNYEFKRNTMQDAREVILSGHDHASWELPNIDIPADVFAGYLCGYIDLNAWAENYLKEYKDLYTEWKAYHQKLKNIAL